MCRHGVVRFESVMKLREKLDHLGQMKGITQDEKGLAIIVAVIIMFCLH